MPLLPGVGVGASAGDWSSVGSSDPRTGGVYPEALLGDSDGACNSPGSKDPRTGGVYPVPVSGAGPNPPSCWVA